MLNVYVRYFHLIICRNIEVEVTRRNNFYTLWSLGWFECNKISILYIRKYSKMRSDKINLMFYCILRIKELTNWLIHSHELAINKKFFSSISNHLLLSIIFEYTLRLLSIIFLPEIFHDVWVDQFNKWRRLTKYFMHDPYSLSWVEP